MSLSPSNYNMLKAQNPTAREKHVRIIAIMNVCERTDLLDQRCFFWNGWISPLIEFSDGERQFAVVDGAVEEKEGNVE